MIAWLIVTDVSTEPESEKCIDPFEAFIPYQEADGNGCFTVVMKDNRRLRVHACCLRAIIQARMKSRR